MKRIQKRTIAFLQIIILFYCFHVANAQIQRDLFAKYSDTVFLREALVTKETWQPFSKELASTKASLPDSVIQQIIQQGIQAENYNWPIITATLMLDYSRTGNRTRYQNAHFERREKLRDLILAEFLDNKGRFTDQVINGIWAICEESYWGLPPHLYLQASPKNLANVDEPTVDLFAAETASLLSWAYYLLKDKLDEVSPRVSERIKSEMNRRILTPNFEREDFWWMGLNTNGRRVNNWNPWIVSNWLTAVLIFEDNEERKLQSILKIMKVLGQFVNTYPEDGGCDEGPSYWGHAGASLFDCLELLSSATNGKISIYNEPVIQNIGSYIYKAYIGDNYFVNFADATASLQPNSVLIYRYGQRINNVNMQNFAAYLWNKQHHLKLERNLFRAIPTLQFYNELSETNSDFKFSLDVWLPDSEIMAARSNDQNKGFYIAAKAGHNAESHNHNDVGNFIVYYDAMPVLVDAGVGTYTAKTFSSERYDIWNMQSAFHNLPTVNGYQQKVGRGFEASEVKYKINTRWARMSMDLKKAYPLEANIDSWVRTIQLNRNKNVVLTDKYSLSSSTINNDFSLITPCAVTITEPGEIKLNLLEKEKARTIYINYDASLFSVKQEQINMEGEENTRLRQVWSNGLTRIILTEKKSLTKATWKFLISSY